ncbi:hypothetical protein, partial [Klebsiella pneumoniae]|uniref:hypothetical protein n=1 Tax=Klebsiella pneumoniae TaxID=573 RepID=UPI0013B39F39
MKKYFLISFFLFSSASVEAAPDPLIPYFKFVNPEFDWAKEQWTGNDTPFLVTMKRLDAQISNNKKLNVLTDQYRLVAEREPQSAVAQFTYSYALWH